MQTENSLIVMSKTEVQRDVHNSKVRKQDKYS